MTIRLLDPPLHEFVPHDEKDIKKLAKEMIMPIEELQPRSQARMNLTRCWGTGCRLSFVTYPEIAEMQTRAIIEAATEVSKEKGITIRPEIMIPLVGEARQICQRYRRKNC